MTARCRRHHRRPVGKQRRQPKISSSKSSTFPLELIDKGIAFKCKEGKASFEADKVRILKAIGDGSETLDAKVHGVVACARAAPRTRGGRHTARDLSRGGAERQSAQAAAHRLVSSDADTAETWREVVGCRARRDGYGGAEHRDAAGRPLPASPLSRLSITSASPRSHVSAERRLHLVAGRPLQRPHLAHVYQYAACGGPHLVAGGPLQRPHLPHVYRYELAATSLPDLRRPHLSSIWPHLVAGRPLQRPHLPHVYQYAGLPRASSAAHCLTSTAARAPPHCRRASSAASPPSRLSR